MNIPYSQRTPRQKEWYALSQREQKFLNKRTDKKESALNNLLAKKIPEKLQNTLDTAFEKAFSLIFEKGTEIIEKTYRKEDMKKDFKVRVYADKTYRTRKTIHNFSKNADILSNVNLTISGISGVGMGLLGVGIPDIPIFTGMILKCIYEIALNYGFDYSSEKDKYFILLIIKGAVSYGERLKQTDIEIETFMRNPNLPENYDFNQQIAETSSVLSKELLYMKFLQGIPIVGAVGGAYDVIYMKQISEYARIKYQKRFLLNYRSK